MTVDDWRNKHRKCKFCSRCRTVPYDPLQTQWCTAKQKKVNPELPRLLCSLFDLRKVSE